MSCDHRNAVCDDCGDLVFPAHELYKPGVRYTFPDKCDDKCYLVVAGSGNGEVSIHGWNDNIDSFTSIDLSAGAAATVADVLREISDRWQP